MERKCVVCHDKAISFRCIQCHKPVCSDCAFKTEHGAFCGRECSAMYREFKKGLARAPVRHWRGLFKQLLVLIVVAAIALAVAYKLGWVNKLPGLSRDAVVPPSQTTD